MFKHVPPAPQPELPQAGHSVVRACASHLWHSEPFEIASTLPPRSVFGPLAGWYFVEEGHTHET